VILPPRSSTHLRRKLLEHRNHRVDLGEVELGHQSRHFWVIWRQIFVHIDTERRLLLSQQGRNVVAIILGSAPRAGRRNMAHPA
jgi:hypothetical protein